jgi:hypothetical protein
LTDLRRFAFAPDLLAATIDTLSSSLLLDLRDTKRWTEWCPDLASYLAQQRGEETELRAAVDGIIDRKTLPAWETWVRTELAGESTVCRDHLREEKEFAVFLRGIADEVRKAAQLRGECEAEIERLRRLR